MKDMFFALTAGFIFFYVLPCFAQTSHGQRVRECSRVDTKWEAKADKNNDGTVDRVEAHQWQRRRHRVSNELEKKYDADCDGYLDSQETKEMLKDKCALINTQGKAKVDSPLEAEYDANHDGVIDAKEAGPLKEALK